MDDPKCEGCGHGIVGRITFTADGKTWHELCWQKKCNDYYFEQTLDADEFGPANT